MTKISKKVNDNKAGSVLGITRISLGLIFLWAFIDKVFGLGFATCRSATADTVEIMCKSAWLQGGSPTKGFLAFGTSGPFAEFYKSLAGNPVIDWLFMIGLLGIGIALVLGIGMKIASYSGAVLVLMMYSATLLPANHPFLDDHIIYALVLLALLYTNDNQKFGYGKQWAKTELVKKYPVLQ